MVITTLSRKEAKGHQDRPLGTPILGTILGIVKAKKTRRVEMGSHDHQLDGRRVDWVGTVGGQKVNVNNDNFFDLDRCRQAAQRRLLLSDSCHLSTEEAEDVKTQ